jgi:hypothetical protein
VRAGNSAGPQAEAEREGELECRSRRRARGLPAARGRPAPRTTWTWRSRKASYLYSSATPRAVELSFASSSFVFALLVQSLLSPLSVLSSFLELCCSNASDRFSLPFRATVQAMSSKSFAELSHVCGVIELQGWRATRR